MLAAREIYGLTFVAGWSVVPVEKLHVSARMSGEMTKEETKANELIAF